MAQGMIRALLTLAAIVFAAPVLAFSITTSTSGPQTSLSIVTTLTPDASDINQNRQVFVVASVNGSLFANNGTGWPTVGSIASVPPYYVGVLPSSLRIALATDFDFSVLPGLQVYVGYGLDIGEVIASVRYKLAFSTPPTLSRRLAALRMVNWYPSAKSWTNMWIEFDPLLIQSEFKEIAALGFNAVRIFPNTPSPAFSLPKPPAEMLQRLAEVVQLADGAGLKVQLTLFDIWGGYANPGAVQDTQAWVDAVVAPYANDQRIAYIDVQNEVDLSRPEVLAWVKAIVPYVKAKAGNIPVTVSFPSLKFSDTLSAMSAIKSNNIPIDFFDVHYYFPPEFALAQLKAVQSAAGSLPVFIGESGFPTATDFAWIGSYGASPTQAAREALQEKYFRSLHHAARALGLPAPSPWTFNDFEPSGIPSYLLSYFQSQGFGSSQFTFGLHRPDGSRKPSHAVLRSLNAGEPISNDINGGFEQFDALGLPIYWRLQNNPALGYTAQFGIDTNVARAGKASARISNATGSNQGTPAFFATAVPQIRESTPVTLSAYAKGFNVTGAAYVSLAWFDINGSYLTKSRSTSLPKGNPDWTMLSVTAYPPLGAAGVELHLESEANPAGTIWFDEVTLQGP